MQRTEMIDKLVDNIINNITEDSNLGMARLALADCFEHWSEYDLKTELTDREIKNA